MHIQLVSTYIHMSTCRQTPLIPAEKGLANSWRTWRRILYKFYKQRGPVRILEIGAYRGEATAWFLRNLCGHTESRVYAVDTFQGSAEYTDANFNAIERAFYTSINATGRQAQVETLKMMSYQALLQLSAQFQRKPHFDVVLIDASHEAADVMMDGVMAFPLLKVGGVMIFDDYKWEKLVQAYYRPKVAIDGFIEVMRPYVRVLRRGWQLLLEKTERQDAPVVTETVHKRLRKYIPVFLRNACLTYSTPLHLARLTPDHVRVRSVLPMGPMPTPSNMHSFAFAPQSVGYHLSFLVKPHIPKQFKHLAVLHHSLAYNKVVNRFQQIGLQKGHYTHFANYLRLVDAYAPKRNQQWTYLNCRSAYDFCGQFYTDNAFRNYTQPLAALAYHPHRFYDLSCTNQFDKFKTTSLFGAPLLRDAGNYHSYRLNQWSLRNWVDIARALESQIDVLNVHCLIPSTQLIQSATRSSKSVTYAEEASPLSVQRDRCALVSVYFAILVQRKGGCCCITLAHKTIHTSLMIHLLWVLHHLYKHIHCRFSSYTGSKNKIYVDCVHFRGVEPGQCQALYSALLQMDKTFHPISLASASTIVEPVGLGVTPSKRFCTHLRTFNADIVAKLATLYKYYEYVADLDQQLANIPPETRYQLVESHQIHIYVRWCNELNMLYKRLCVPPTAHPQPVRPGLPTRRGVRTRTTRKRPRLG